MFPLLLVAAFSTRKKSRDGPSTAVYGRRIGIPTNPESFLSFRDLGLPLSPAPPSFIDRLFGDSLFVLGISLPDGENTTWTPFAKLPLTQQMADRLHDLVRSNYSYEFLIGNRAALCPIGAVTAAGSKLFTSFDFHISRPHLARGSFLFAAAFPQRLSLASRILIRR
jgi:hypothetical protein